MIKNKLTKEEKETQLLIQESIGMSKFFRKHKLGELAEVVDVLVKQLQSSENVQEKSPAKVRVRTSSR